MIEMVLTMIAMGCVFWIGILCLDFGDQARKKNSIEDDRIKSTIRKLIAPSIVLGLVAGMLVTIVSPPPFESLTLSYVINLDIHPQTGYTHSQDSCYT